MPNKKAVLAVLAVLALVSLALGLANVNAGDPNGGLGGVIQAFL